MSSLKISVVGVVFQNNFGERYFSRYFTKNCPAANREPFNLSAFDGQRKFQKALLEKVGRMNVISRLKPQQSEIFSLGEFSVLLKVINELQIYLICDQEENYFIMESVIDCIGKTLTMIEKEPLLGKAIYDHLDSIVTITDELIDQGIIVHLDPNVIYDRVKMRDPSDPSAKKGDSKGQQQSQGGGFSSFFGFAKSSLQKTLNLG